ncbi:MAG: hypothetical protein QNI97_12355 [Desulfobacterales bacterium]|nr:hypothetical protein [Desulfobacterales bacterium]
MPGGICLLTVWCGGTLAGNRLGAFVPRPEAFGLDFALTAVFTALLAGVVVVALSPFLSV